MKAGLPRSGTGAFGRADVAVRVPVARPSLPPFDRFAAAMDEVWKTRRLSNDGPFAREFERAFAAYCGGGGVALCASSCDVALTLVVRALDLPRGARAVIPSLGFPSTVHALQWNGLQPRFIDVDPGDWCLHPEQLDGELEDVSLILATHLFGAPCDVSGLMRVSARHGVHLVFDAAHATATWAHGRHVSDFGDGSVVSFSATKIATGAEAGIAVLRSRAYADRFRRLRAYGLDDDRVSREQGLNAKLSELHAALGVLALEEIEHEVARRGELVELYRAQLTDVPGVALQAIPPHARPTPALFVVAISGERRHARAALREHGIESRPYFPALHRMPRLADVPRSHLPVSEHLDASLLALPLYSELAPSTVVEICEILAAAVADPQTEDG